MRETLREFCDRTDRETWRGTSSAYRAGAKAALTDAECNYVLRRDLGDAWKRGFDAMLEFIAADGEIQLGEDARIFGRGADGKPAEAWPGNAKSAKRAYKRRAYGLR